MNKRYTASLDVSPEPKKEELPIAVDSTEQETGKDLVMDLLDSLFTENPNLTRQHFEDIYDFKVLSHAAVVGLSGLIRGSMFESVWEALNRPDNAEFSVKHESSDLPSWFVRFETTDKTVRVVSCELNKKFYTLVLRKLNEMLEGRAGVVEITQFTPAQFQHFIKVIFKTLRNL